MSIGDRRRQVALQSRSDTLDDYGQRVRTWATVANIMAHVEPLYGRELEAARATMQQVTHRITIRYRTNIAAQMRFVYAGRYFNINAIMDTDTRHRELQVLCTEGTNDG